MNNQNQKDTHLQIKPKTHFSRRSVLIAGGSLGVMGLLSSCHRITNETPLPVKDLPAGLDLSQVDANIPITNDLYRHVNGKWLKDFVIPADKSSFGTFSELDNQKNKHLHEIIKKLQHKKTDSKSENYKIVTLYNSYTDINYRDSLGITPISNWLTKIDAANNKTELTKILAQLQRIGTAGLFELNIAPDLHNSNKNTVYLNQGGITLPTREYYLNPQYQPIQIKYQKTLEKFFQLFNLTNPNETATKVYNLELALAKKQWSEVKLRDVEKNYNPVTYENLNSFAPEFNWKIWIKYLGGNKENFKQIILGQPSFATYAGAIWNQTDLLTLKNFVKWNVIKSKAPYLSTPVTEIYFDFFQKTLNGVTKPIPLWESGVKLINSALPDAIGKLYIAKHFPREAKQNIINLIDNIKAAYRESFVNLDWMSPQTRNAAIAKLNKINIKVGYPDKWQDYSKIILTENNIIKNIENINEFNFIKDLHKLNHPVDKTEWEISVATVNAYYDSSKNEIVFPAAILQAPFFNPKVDPAANYGGIGAVIGHEIGHAFDDQGSKFDGNGNKKEWWTAADREKYQHKTEKLIAQYNQLIPTNVNGKHVNGALTVGENLADLGGLSIALRAYEIELNKKKKAEISNSHKIDGYTDLQRVFLNWARIWRQKTRPTKKIQLLELDPHSPNEFRTNQTVRNIDYFYKAFNVKETDKMFLKPEDRVKIW